MYSVLPNALCRGTWTRQVAYFLPGIVCTNPLPQPTSEESCKNPPRLSPHVNVGLWLSAASNLREKIRIISGTREANIHSTIRWMPSRKFFPTRIEGRGGDRGQRYHPTNHLVLTCFGWVSHKICSYVSEVKGKIGSWSGLSFSQISSCTRIVKPHKHIVLCQSQASVCTCVF